MATGITHLTTATFDETVASSTAPVLEEMAAELGDQLTIAKLNVDEHPDIAMRYSVMSIPTLLLIHDGDVKKKIVGAKGKGALMQELGEFLGTSR